MTLTYFPSTGLPVTRTVSIPAGQRLTRNIALEDPSPRQRRGGDARRRRTPPSSPSARRYWGAGRWIEGHNSAGVHRVVAALGAWPTVGSAGADAAQTYVLLANTGTDGGDRHGDVRPQRRRGRS